MYIIGIDREIDNDFQWPGPWGTTPPLSRFLDDCAGAKRDQPDATKQNTAYTNLKAALASLAVHRIDPNKADIVVDIDASPARMHMMCGISPCITHSRPRGYWCTSRRRRLNIHELLRLQGFNPSSLCLLRSRRLMGQLIGNSMSVNVLEALFTDLVPMLQR